MESKKPSILSCGVVFIVFIVIAVWAAVSIATNDAMWFLPSFTENASTFDLYWDGELVQVAPGDPEYERLNEAFREEVTHINSFPKGAGLSDAMLNHLQAAGRLLEVHFAEPARVHSPYHFGPSTVYYIPLSSHHAWSNRVFNSGRGTPLELKNMALLMAAVEEIVVSSDLGSP